MKKRLKALEAKVAQEGGVLTESQLAALEKAKADKEAHGEFDRVVSRFWWKFLGDVLRASVAAPDQAAWSRAVGSRG